MPKMPIDVKQVIEAAVGFGQECDEALVVDVVFDATASDALIGALSAALCENVQAENADVAHYVLSGGLPALRAGADLCVVVGGQSRKLGNVMGTARNNGTAAVCVIERDVTFFTDGVAGADAEGETGAAASAAGAAGAGVAASAPSIPIPDETEYVAAIDVDDIVDVDLSGERPLDPLALWAAARLPKKRLALGVAFPFMRHALARELAQSNAIENAAIGVVAFVPGADMPLITANQVKLVLQMAAIYGKELDKDRVKEAAAVVVGAFGWRALARRLAKLVPVLGIPVKTGVAYTGTLAVGHAACAYFENGGEEKYEKAVETVVEKGKGLFTRADAA